MEIIKRIQPLKEENIWQSFKMDVINVYTKHNVGAELNDQFEHFNTIFSL